MATLLRCGQLLRTRAAASAAQQVRQQSVFNDISSKLKKQVDGNPELKQQFDKLKGTAEQLQQQAAAGVQQAQEVLRQATGQQAGGGQQQPGSSARPSGSATDDGSGGAADGGPTGEAASAAGQRHGAAAGDAGGPGSDGAGAGSEQHGAGAGAGGSAGASQQTGSGSGSGRRSASWTARGRGALETVWAEVSEAVFPSPEKSSATKRRAEGLRQPAEGAGPAEVLIVEQPESIWRKRWQAFAGKYADHPLFRRVSSASQTAASKGRDAAEDLKERWETSNSPLVHRIQDMSDTVFTETEMARAYREIAQRDPGFDMPAFLRQLRADVPVIVRAYLLGDIPALQEHCAPEMVERLTAIIRAQQAQGMLSDATLLDISEVELADIKFLEADPVVVVQFNCQQINCTRDKFGNVTEGAPDDVQRVYYFWALQQDAAGFVGSDGKAYPPRWQLREMLVQGMIPLVG